MTTFGPGREHPHQIKVLVSGYFRIDFFRGK
jgi:hypothetical protein